MHRGILKLLFLTPVYDFYFENKIVTVYGKLARLCWHYGRRSTFKVMPA